MKKQNGFSIAAIIVPIALLTAIGYLGWYVWQANQKVTEPASSEVEVVPTDSDKKPETRTEVFVGGKVTLQLPGGWSKVQDTIAQTVVGAKTFEIMMNLEDQDHFKGQYFYDPVSEFKNITTTKGTKLYVVKTPHPDLMVSSCPPTEGKGCSPVVDGKFLKIYLLQHEKGDQSVRPIDFNSQEINQAINESLEILTTSSL